MSKNNKTTRSGINEKNVFENRILRIYPVFVPPVKKMRPDQKNRIRKFYQTNKKRILLFIVFIFSRRSHCLYQVQQLFGQTAVGNRVITAHQFQRFAFCHRIIVKQNGFLRLIRKRRRACAAIIPRPDRPFLRKKSRWELPRLC